ncbi:MAG: UDP-N-acetylglucosamine 2-epimerase [Cetobacterium sp.]
MKKICVVTGTRAEYGLLKPLIKKMEEHKNIDLSLVITGMHLSPEFGNTYKIIENDFKGKIYKVEMLLSSDTDAGISKSVGLGIISYTDLLEKIKPDFLLVLGDRYEIFSIVTVANILKIPVIHLHGGEKTEGAYDEAFRHCISKMSYLHFTSTEEYRQRVIQLGETPDRVFNVGAIGVENINSLDIIPKEVLEKQFQFKISDNMFVIVYHPVTLEENSAGNQIKELLKAIKKSEIDAIFIKANSDTNGRIINRELERFVEKNKKKYKLFSSLTSEEYLNILKYSQGLIGNSSSGILETPSLKIGSLNIGDRQRGRIRAESTIHCEAIENDILNGIEKLKSLEFKDIIDKCRSPYGDGNVSDKIMGKILEIKKINLKKEFYDLALEMGKNER